MAEGGTVAAPLSPRARQIVATARDLLEREGAAAAPLLRAAGTRTWPGPRGRSPTA